MNLDFVAVLRKRLEETAEKRLEEMTAQLERLALEQLSDAGGSVTASAFAASWEHIGEVVLRHLELRGWACLKDDRVELTDAGRSALQK